MSATGAIERAAVLAAEQQLFRFLRAHLDPNETRDALVLAQDWMRAARAEERRFARHEAERTYEDELRRRDAGRCF